MKKCDTHFSTVYCKNNWYVSLLIHNDDSVFLKQKQGRCITTHGFRRLIFCVN